MRYVFGRGFDLGVCDRGRVVVGCGWRSIEVVCLRVWWLAWKEGRRGAFKVDLADASALVDDNEERDGSDDEEGDVQEDVAGDEEETVEEVEDRVHRGGDEGNDSV